MPKKGARKGGGGPTGSKREAEKEKKEEKKKDGKKIKHERKEEKEDDDKVVASTAEPTTEKIEGKRGGEGSDVGGGETAPQERLHPVDLDTDDAATTIIEKAGDAAAKIVDAGSSDLADPSIEDGAKEINQDDIENLIDQMDDSNARQILRENDADVDAPETTETAKPHRTALSGLEVLDIPGPEALRETLTNSTDPLKSIEDFQRANGILLPSLTPALPFLDLHGMDRREFHQTILNEISDKLFAKIEKLGALSRRCDQPEMADDARRKLERLLDANFPVIRVKQLQPIVLSTMKHLPAVRPDILEQVMNDAELYKASATEVKRQIWEGNQSLFGDEVAPLLEAYIVGKTDALFSVESSAVAFLSLAPKVRRQSRVVSDLALYVGDKILLYDLVLQFLRTLYLTTRDMHYCTLRAEVLMALHDTKVSKITAEDPCYKFTWCLDACITDKSIDEKRGVELQMFMEGISKDQEQVLGDLAMIMSDPYAVHAVMTSIFKSLQSCLKNDQLPKDNHELVVLLKMLNLGVHAWEMIETQVFKERKLHPELLSKFLPCVLAMMVDDKQRLVKVEIAAEEHEIAKLAAAGLPPGTQDPPKKIPDPEPPAKPAIYFKNYVKHHAVGALIGMYYTMNLVKQRDRLGLCNILPSIVHFHNEVLYEDVFLHTLVTLLINNMSTDFSNDDFCMAIFDDFLFECASPPSKGDGAEGGGASQMIKENVMKHSLRLLWYVYPKMNVSRVETLLDFIKPSKEHSEATQKLHRTLCEKVSSGQKFATGAGNIPETPTPAATVETNADS